MVWGDPCTKGSETAKVGTDEQKLHMRLITMGKVTQHTNAYNQQLLIVDAAGINRRIMLLPGEVSKTTCSHMEKSADTIVPVKRKLSPKVKRKAGGTVLATREGLNVKQLLCLLDRIFRSHWQMQQGKKTYANN